MAAATTIKVIKTKTGKAKFQAQVWHKGVFYASKTFDIESLVRATTVRLKVEQIQLVSGVEQVVLGGIGLQGA